MKEMNQTLSLCFKKWFLQLQQQKAIMMIRKGLASFYRRDFPLTQSGFTPIPSPYSQPTWFKLSRAVQAPRYSWAEWTCPGGHVRGQTWGVNYLLWILCLKPSSLDLALVPGTSIINYVSTPTVYTGFLFIMKYLLQGSASVVKLNSSIYSLCRGQVSP